MLELRGVAPFSVQVRASKPSNEGVSVRLTHMKMLAGTRDQMITKLYTGSYSQEIDTLRSSRIFGDLWLRAFEEREQVAH